MKNIASFIKIRFYSKRGCIKARKHAETFLTNKYDKLAIVVFISTSTFQNRKFVVHFSNIICTKTWPFTPLFFIWKWITSALSFIWLETNGNIFSPWGPVFPTVPFFRGLFFLRSRFRVLFLDDPLKIPVFNLNDKYSHYFFMVLCFLISRK